MHVTVNKIVIFYQKWAIYFLRNGVNCVFVSQNCFQICRYVLACFHRPHRGKKKKNETKWLVPDKLSIALFRGVYTSPDCGSHICNKTCQGTKQISFKLSKKDIFGYLNST